MSTEGGLLTAEELESVNATWSLVAKDLKGNGAAFFVHFFTEYPEYQQIFRGFGNVPVDQLATNKRLIAHGYTVMSAIGGLVENLEDPEVLTELLLNTGRNHIKRKLKVGDFQNLKTSLLGFLSKALGSELSPVGAGAWDKVLGFVVCKIGEGLSSEH